MQNSPLIARLENLVFGNRSRILAVAAVITVIMLVAASRIGIDAGFSKLLPLRHEYMKTYVKHRQAFGGANRILIALVSRDGDIFNPEFFQTLKTVTDKVFFIPGVDRTQVSSLFTPNVRFTEVVEDGISGGNVVPADFQPTPDGLAQVRRNILKAGIVGRLVANDFSGALVSVQLQEINPATGEPLDYVDVAHQFNRKIRDGGPYDADVDIHIIGYAMVIGDIADGTLRVILFFGIAFLVTALLVFLYAKSFQLMLVPIACSLISVIWQLGLLTLLGYGIDPLGILVPFLVFAIAVSHGVQMISAVRVEVADGLAARPAARRAFRRLLIPGSVALISDTMGFITILLIRIQAIQEMAVAASLGVAVIIVTNLILLPVLISFFNFDDRYRNKLKIQAKRLASFWNRITRVADPAPAAVVLLLSAALFLFGAWQGSRIRVGDMHRGVPELRADSRYNIDSEIITDRFSIGVDTLSVIVETVKEGCIDYDIMTTIDDFAWRMQNIEGVQSVISLPGIARGINAGWNEGNPKWRVLPRNQSMLVQSVCYVPTTTGLLNEDCSIMPVMIFTADHKAETIERIVSEVKQFQTRFGSDRIAFRLATGNVGVMAATNEEVKADQFPILLGVFIAVILLCLLTFRSIRAVLCIVIPLGLVSLLAYALMTLLEIGLKISTLPVVALGVGIGVDYGIYFFSSFRTYLNQGMIIREAYRNALRTTGNGVVFTGLTLAISVATWIFSPLKFQADMGILLTFMFLVNMLGAILLLPALATWLLKPGGRSSAHY